MSAEKWFMKHDVRSFSPQTSSMFLDCVQSIDNAMKAGGDKDEGADEVISYRNALYLVAKMSHLQQGIVIKRFAELIGERK